MATYKVPQDVEAEDKLFGPFGFRQFIYLGIAVGAGFLAYIFFQIFPLLGIIPLPIIGLFTLLALPLRKEQPMETYMLALLRFYLKPKQRKWDPDGTVTYVEIVAPKTVEHRLSKDFDAAGASQRISYLARVMDSRGWALKGMGNPGTNISTDILAEAQSAVDVFDESTSISQSFNNMIAKNDEQRRQTMIDQMRRATQPAPQATAQPATMPAPHYDPYPSSMHQRVIQPLGQAATPTTAQPATPQTPVAQSTTPATSPAPQTTLPAAQAPSAPAQQPAVPRTVSPDIMRLASNDDLSISAIAHEAHRLTDGQDEVVVKLH